jgi:hypothetical protein
MSDPLSSEDGTQDNDGDYETLEDRIYNANRPPSDEEEQVKFRIEAWTRTEIEMVKTAENTSEQEVTINAYILGLSELRDEIGMETIKDITQMRYKFMNIYADTDLQFVDPMRIDSVLQNIDVDARTKMGNKFDGGFARPILPNSVTSEVSDTMDDRLSLSDSDIHRVCLVAGLTTSDNTSDRTGEYKLEMFNSLQESLEEARRVVEDKISDYAISLIIETDECDMDEEMVEQLEELVDHMATEYEKKARYALEKINMEEKDE